VKVRLVLLEEVLNLVRDINNSKLKDLVIKDFNDEEYVISEEIMETCKELKISNVELLQTIISLKEHPELFSKYGVSITNTRLRDAFGVRKKKAPKVK
jgi:hypothetical protein